MLTYAASTVVRDDRPAYRPFAARVVAVRELAPGFRRVTFTGPELADFGTDRRDQRVKIVLPIEGVGISDIGWDGDWYARWRALPDAVRNPFRTYTVRDVRPAESELDVDFVVHPAGETGLGPAARWLERASAGDEVVIVGPDARSVHSAIGIDWHPGTATEYLIAGDETAVPAILGILESLGAGTRARVFVSLPTASGALPHRSDAEVEVTWIARDSGGDLEARIRGWLEANPHLFVDALASAPQALEEVDVDVDLLWDSPGDANGGFYAWLAGESALIKALRRLLVSETGIDRSRVAFMGYWRRGRAEAQ